MESGNIVFWVLKWFSAVVITILIIYVLIVLGKHGLRRMRDRIRWKKYCKDNKISSGVDFAFNLLLDRRYSYFSSYFLFLILDKGFGILGVGFSIIGLMAASSDTPLAIELLVSFLALVFVVMALYVSPGSRVAMYLSKWQECDGKVNYMLGNIECHSKYLDCESQKKLLDDIVGFIKACEVDLTNADL